MTQLFKDRAGALWKLTLRQRDKELFDAETQKIYQEVSKQLREMRKNKGVSLRKLAKHVKYSAPYVSDVELGRRNPTVEFVGKFYSAIDALAEP